MMGIRHLFIHFSFFCVLSFSFAFLKTRKICSLVEKQRVFFIMKNQSGILAFYSFSFFVLTLNSDGICALNQSNFPFNIFFSYQSLFKSFQKKKDIFCSNNCTCNFHSDYLYESTSIRFNASKNQRTKESILAANVPSQYLFKIRATGFRHPGLNSHRHLT